MLMMNHVYCKSFVRLVPTNTLIDFATQTPEITEDRGLGETYVGQSNKRLSLQRPKL